MKSLFLINALLFVNVSYAYDVYSCLNKSEEEAKKQLSDKIVNGKKYSDAGTMSVKVDMGVGQVPKIHFTMSGHFGEGVDAENFKNYDFVVEDAVNCTKPLLVESPPYDVYGCFSKSEEEAKKQLSDKIVNGKKFSDAGTMSVKMDMGVGQVPKIHFTMSGHFGEGVDAKNFKNFDFIVEDAITCSKPKLQEKSIDKNREQVSCAEQLQYLQDKNPEVYNTLKREFKNFHGVVEKSNASKESSGVQK